MTTATTTASPVVAPIQHNSELGAVFPFIQNLAGTKQQQTSTGKESSVVRGQTGPLEAILAQMSDPNALMAMVAQLFSQGAAQVPALTTQFANATGTRPSGNTMLGQSLGMLNTTLAQQLAQIILAQQTAAATAAGKLGEINKTSSGMKEGGQRSESKMNAGRALTGTAGALGVGTILNKVGKKYFDPVVDKGINAVDSTISNFFAPSPGTFAAVPAPSIIDAGLLMGGNSFVDAGTGVLDFSTGMGIDHAGAAFGDPVGAGAFVDAGASVAGDVGTDVASFYPTEDLASLFLADGGVVKGKKVTSDQEIIPTGRGYADGTTDGIVRNKPNFGEAPPIRLSGPQPTGFSLRQRSKVGSEFPEMGVTQEADFTSADKSFSSNAPGTALSFSPSQAFTAAGLTGLAASPAGPQVAIPAALFALFRSILMQDLAASLTSTPATVSQEEALGFNPAGPTPGMLGLTTGHTPVAAAPNPESLPPGTIVDEGQVEGTYGPIAGALSQALFGTPGNSFSAPGSAWSAALEAMGPADFGAATEGGFGFGGMGSSNEGGGSPGGGAEGAADGSPSLSKKVKNKHRNAGVDSIPIMVSENEYVIPEDVVEIVGRDTLDDLVASLHTPIRTK